MTKFNSNLKKHYLPLTFLVLLVAIPLIAIFTPMVYALGDPEWTDIYFEGPEVYDDDMDGNYNFTTIDLGVGDTFNTTIKIRNVTELYSWQVRVWFNNTVLNCTKAYYHPDDPVSSGPSIPVLPEINNSFNATHGYVQHGACALMANYSGSFPVCIIEFEVTMAPPEAGSIETILSLNNTWTYLLWVDGKTDIECTKIDGWYGYYDFGVQTIIHEIIWDETSYYVVTESNVSISQAQFSHSGKSLSFNATAMSGLTGYMNVTIPNDFLWDNPWTIYIDGEPLEAADFTETENATHAFLYFTWLHESTVQLTIKGTGVVPEFPLNLLLPLLMTLTAIAIAKGRIVRRKNQAK